MPNIGLIKKSMFEKGFESESGFNTVLCVTNFRDVKIVLTIHILIRIFCILIKVGF